MRSEPSFPSTPAECRCGPRPCPWIRCEFHVYPIVQDFWEPRSGRRSQFYGLEPWELPASCVLDVIEAAPMHNGKMTLEAIGSVLGYCRERIRQIEQGAIESLTPAELRLLRDAWEPEPPLPASSIEMY